MSRLEGLKRFYSLLDALELRNGGCRMLSNCSGRMGWPKRGVYFFYEHGENRSDTGKGLRVVRVGTHALKCGAKSTLWKRLRGHKGTEKMGGGNHRGSVFRLLIGTALIKKNSLVFDSWGIGKVFYNSAIPPDAPSCALEKYNTKSRTNWQYECAKAFLNSAKEI